MTGEVVNSGETCSKLDEQWALSNQGQKGDHSWSHACAIKLTVVAADEPPPRGSSSPSFIPCLLLPDGGASCRPSSAWPSEELISLNFRVRERNRERAAGGAAIVGFSSLVDERPKENVAFSYLNPFELITK